MACAALLLGLLAWPLAAGTDATASATAQSPWSGFGVGSWVVIQTRTTSAQASEQRRRKMIIVDNDPTRPLVGVASEVQGRFESPFRTGRQVAGFLPHQLGLTLASTGSATQRIDGRSHRCITRLYRLIDRRNGLERTLKLWHAREIRVPYREIIVDRGANVALAHDVVRAAYTVRIGGRTKRYELQMTGQAETVQVGPQLLRCTLERATAELREGKDHTVVESQRWLSDSVPGHIVLLRGSVRINQVTVQKEQRVESFHVTAPESGPT